MGRLFIVLGSLAALLGVGLGAFGAHGLKQRLAEPMMAVYQTAVQYHLIHALGLVLVGIVVEHYSSSTLARWSGWLLLAGICLFSGSLYLVATTELRRLGILAPIGGLAFMLGWLCLAIAVARQV